MRGRLLRGSLVAFAIASLVAARLLVASADEQQLAELALSRGDRDAAIVHYRRAARLYVPLSPFVGRALDGLRAQALRAEQEGDIPRALAAWRAIHAATMGARSVYVPHVERLREADVHVAHLMASLPPPARDHAIGAAARERGLRRELARDRDPRLGWRLVALGGFLAWLAGLLALALRGIDAEDRWVPPAARRAGTLIVAGLSLFVLGLALA